MATKLTATLGALVVALAPYAGATLAEDSKAEFRDSASGAALGGTSYKEKVGATRGSTSEGSIQNRFGGSSGLVLGGGSGGTASSGGTTGAVMGNRVLDGGPQRNYRDDRPSDHSKKWGEQPGKGYAKGHAKRTH